MLSLPKSEGDGVAWVDGASRQPHQLLELGGLRDQVLDNLRRLEPNEMPVHRIPALMKPPEAQANYLYLERLRCNQLGKSGKKTRPVCRVRARVEDRADSLGVVGVGHGYGWWDSFDLHLEVAGRVVTPELAVGEIVKDVELSDESERGVRLGNHLVVPAGDEAVDVPTRLLPPAVHHQALQEPHVEEGARLVLHPVCCGNIRSVCAHQLATE